MKRFALREFLLLCAPVALIGAGVLAVRVFQRDPDAKIKLSVTPGANQMTLLDNFAFTWRATASGGPKNSVGIGYSQKIVAMGHGRTQTILSEPVPLVPAKTRFVDRREDSHSGGNKPTDLTFTWGLSYSALPIWTEHLQWQAQIVAVPRDWGAKGPTTGPVSAATLQGWAQIKGAASVFKRVPVALDAKQLAPVGQCKLVPVKDPRVSYGADTRVTTRYRAPWKRIFARLVAFDGSKRRVLWQSDGRKSGVYDPYALDKPGEMSTSELADRLSDDFKLRDAPTKWGEIVYLMDVVFDPNPTKNGFDYCDAQAIERLADAGWLHYSRRLTVRAKGAITKAPVSSSSKAR